MIQPAITPILVRIYLSICSVTAELDFYPLYPGAQSFNISSLKRTGYRTTILMILLTLTVGSGPPNRAVAIQLNT